MGVSDVISNITKRSMNVMASTFSAFKTREALERQKQKVSANQNNLDTKMLLTIYVKNAYQHLIVEFRNKGVQKSEVEVTSTSETMKKTKVVQNEE